MEGIFEQALAIAVKILQSNIKPGFILWNTGNHAVWWNKDWENQ